MPTAPQRERPYKILWPEGSNTRPLSSIPRAGNIPRSSNSDVGTSRIFTQPTFSSGDSTSASPDAVTPPETVTYDW